MKIQDNTTRCIQVISSLQYNDVYCYRSLRPSVHFVNISQRVWTITKNFGYSFYPGWEGMIPNFVWSKNYKGVFQGRLGSAQSQNYHSFYLPFNFSEICNNVSYCYCNVIQLGWNHNIRKGSLFYSEGGRISNLLKLQTQLTKVSSKTESLRTDLDLNNQYERNDTLIICGPELLITSSSENSKLIVQNSLRRHVHLHLNETGFI